MKFFLIGTLRSNDANGNKNVKKNNTFNEQNNKSARVSCFFVYFFARFCTITTWKCQISRFMEYVNKQRRNFVSLSTLGYGPSGIQLQEGSLTYDKVSG